MPRQKIHHPRVGSTFPKDFPQRLKLFMAAGELSASDLARHIGVSPNTVKRWTAGSRPTSEHLMALQEFADRLGLGHMLSLLLDRHPRLPGF